MSAEQRPVVTRLPRSITSLKSKLNPVLGRFLDTVSDVLDIKDLVHGNDVESTALAARVVRITEEILQKAASSPENERICSDEIGPVQGIINEIKHFLTGKDEVGETKAITRRLDSEETRKHIDTLNDRLNEELIHMTARVVLKLPSEIQTSQLHDGAVRSELSARASLRPSPRPKIFHGRKKVIKAMYGAARNFLSCEEITSAEGLLSSLFTMFGINRGTVEDSAQILTEYLRGTASPALLILDNFETTWDSPDQDAVEQVLGYLDDVDNLALVITIRGTKRPGGVRWSQPALASLGRVNKRTAHRIYLDNGGQLGDGLDNIINLLDGLPLAIVLMVYQGQTRSPRDLLRAYEEEKTTLLQRGAKTHLTSLDVSITLSLNSQTIRNEPSTMEVLILASILPQGLYDDDLDASLPRITDRNKALRLLQDVALVFHIRNKWRVLNPIRDFVIANTVLADEENLVAFGDYLCGPAKTHGTASPGKEDRFADPRTLASNIISLSIYYERRL